MADPGNEAFGIHQERAGNAVAARCRHPGVSHFALFIAGFVIQRNAIGHFLAHLLDEWRDQSVILLPTILADDHQALVLVFVVNLVQVGNGNAARTAPRGPKLDQVSLACLEVCHRLALNPLAVLQFRRRIAHFDGWLGRQGQCRARRQGQRAGRPFQLPAFHSFSLRVWFLARRRWPDKRGAFGSPQDLHRSMFSSAEPLL